MPEWEQNLTDAECEALLDELFPQGPAGDDALAAIAPEGWEKSPWLAVFHPTPETIYEESRQIHENIRSLFKKNDDPTKPEPEPPSLEKIRQEFVEHPVDVKREVLELLCECLWDIFSDNHDVITADERNVDLGSFRGSAGFLADWANRWIKENRYDYMDFYMGTIWVSRRADLTEIYKFIFSRLQRAGLDWIYHFPTIGLVDMRPLAAELDAEKDTTQYDPSAAFQREQEDAEKEKEITEMRRELEQGNREAARQARLGPPPEIVVAYQAVYGRFPKGWPPEVV